MLESQPLRSKDLTQFFSSFATVKECREIEMDLLVRGLQWRTASFTAIAYCRALLFGFLSQHEASAMEEDLKQTVWAIEAGGSFAVACLHRSSYMVCADKEFLKLWPSEAAMTALEVVFTSTGKTQQFERLLADAQQAIGAQHMTQRQPSAVVRLLHVLEHGKGSAAAQPSTPAAHGSSGSQYDPPQTPMPDHCTPVEDPRLTA